MPLVERYNDWSCKDGSYDDPHTLAFDHRIEATGPEFNKIRRDPGIVDLDNNVQATCLITTLKAEYGWTENRDGSWVFLAPTTDPGSSVTLGSHFDRNLRSCVETEKITIQKALHLNEHDSTFIPEKSVKDAVHAMSWPAAGQDSRDKTNFVSRSPPQDQWICGDGYASGYHLGNGYVGTAGHCLVSKLWSNEIRSLKVVFGWVGDVRGKEFPASQVFDIERVILCDAPDDYGDPTDSIAIGRWARAWDNAILKLRGTSSRFKHLAKIEIAQTPPKFGTSLYNVGHPMGTTIKISRRSHVLRHSVHDGDNNPFSHGIDLSGTYTSDLDQFPGNSGGPVLDGTTGKLVGHTVSTQSAVAESSSENIEHWEQAFLHHSENYRLACEIINPYLVGVAPHDATFRVHPKFHRSLSGKPGGGSLFLNTTFICPGDIGPNRVHYRDQTCRAVFNRHRWDSTDVVHRNLTGRIDRIYISTRSLSAIVNEYAGSVLMIHFMGGAGRFEKPASGSRTVLTMGNDDWEISMNELAMETIPSNGMVTYKYTVDVHKAALQGGISSVCLNTPMGLANWTRFRLVQSSDNPPDLVELVLIVRRASFPFPVDQSWPPDRPDVTDNPEDMELKWPAEEFRFSTKMSKSLEVSQMDDAGSCEPSLTSDQRTYEWAAPIDGVWTNPRQPT